uniref:Uncharacterized protein n=1 Tax=Arundo donax TaxID=35708 RepID=A0A0A9EAX2_ARUDO
MQKKKLRVMAQKNVDKFFFVTKRQLSFVRTSSVSNFIP